MKTTTINTNEEITGFFDPEQIGDSIYGRYHGCFDGQYGKVLLIHTDKGLYGVNEKSYLKGIHKKLKETECYQITYIGSESTGKGNDMDKFSVNQFEPESEDEVQWLNKRYKVGLFNINDSELDDIPF